MHHVRELFEDNGHRFEAHLSFIIDSTGMICHARTPHATLGPG